MIDQIPEVPTQPAIPSSPPVKLWTPGFVAAVTFLLGFPAGIVIACINWMRMKMNNKAIIHFFVGAVGTVILVFILLLASSAAGRGIGLLANVGVLFYLQRQIKQDIEAFKMENTVEDAGQIGGCLIGLGTLALFLLMVFVMIIVFSFLGVPIPD